MKYEFILGVDNPDDPINRLRLCGIHLDNLYLVFTQQKWDIKVTPLM